MAKAKSTLSRDKAKRAQLSCYTCRQRKVKCDRVKPCSSCVQYQDPEGCRYDISDDKRQPMLMADAYKQLQRENSELKAKEEDNQAAITKWKAENAALKARLATFQTRSIQSFGHSTQGNSHTWLDRYSAQYPLTKNQPNQLKDVHKTGSISSSSSRSSNVLNGPIEHSSFQNSFVSHDNARCCLPDFHESKALSQALEMINHVVSNTRAIQEPDEMFVHRSVQDLVIVLSNLPSEFPFTLPEPAKSEEALSRPISSQAILVSQTLHSHIITLLSSLGNKRSATDSQSQLRCIRLAEPLQYQLVTSCFVILSLVQYIRSQPDRPFLDSNIHHQSHAALVTLSQLDPPVEEHLYRIQLNQAAVPFHRQEFGKPGPFASMNIHKIPMDKPRQYRTDQYDHNQGNLLSSNHPKGTDLTGVFEYVEQMSHMLPQQSIEDTRPKSWSSKDLAQTDYQATEEPTLASSYPGSPHVYGRHGIRTRSFDQRDTSLIITDHGLVNNRASQIGHTNVFPTNSFVNVYDAAYQHPASQCFSGSVEGLQWNVPTNRRGVVSEPASDLGMSIPLHHTSSVTFHADSTPFMVDDSYAPSVDTSDSSLHTPIQSHPESPTTIQEQPSGIGCKKRPFEFTRQVFEDDRGFSNAGHE